MVARPGDAARPLVPFPESFHLAPFAPQPPRAENRGVMVPPAFGEENPESRFDEAIRRGFGPGPSVWVLAPHDWAPSFEPAHPPGRLFQSGVLIFRRRAEKFSRGFFQR